MTTTARRGLELIEPLVLRAWRAVKRLQMTGDDGALDDGLRALGVEAAELDARIQALDVEGLSALGLDLEGLGTLVRDTVDLLDAAAPTPTGRRCFASDAARAGALTVALQALSAAVRDADPEDGATRASVENLAFELAAALWALGRRPEFVCLTCSTTYAATGVLACPRCR